MDMSFLYNYRGTLYPIDIQDSHAAILQVRKAPTLLDLCCRHIVKDSTTTRHCLGVIPHELCYNLMKAALYLSKDRAIEVLVAHWPWSTLLLRKFAPKLFRDIGTLFNDVHLSDCMRRGVKYTTCLAHTFVECLKKRAPTKLKYLDLTGYPAAEVIVNYLSSHVLLVHNEARQRDIIQAYNSVTQTLPENERQQYTLEATLPDDSYLVTLDAFIQTSEAHMELCKALKHSKSQNSKMRLRLARLDITGLGVARVSVLLDQVDEEHLTGLCLQFNSLNHEGLVILGPAIQQLKNLVSLDLSCNAINLVTQPKCVDLVAETFSHLHCLSRLDLSNSRTKNRLQRVLSQLRHPLQFLRLCACGISELDFQYLKGSHHAKSLQELDISENNLKQVLHHMLLFLQSAGGNLLFLEMEDCDFEEEDFREIFRVCGHLYKLKFWNISRHTKLVRALMMDGVQLIATMESLLFLKVSFPVECYASMEEDDMEEIEAEKLVFSNQISQNLNSVCEKYGRPYIKLVITS